MASNFLEFSVENVAPRDRKHGACALRNSEAVALTRSNKCGACPSLFLACNVLLNNGRQTGFYILSEHPSMSICTVVCFIKKKQLQSHEYIPNKQKLE